MHAYIDPIFSENSIMKNSIKKFKKNFTWQIKNAKKQKKTTSLSGRAWHVKLVKFFNLTCQVKPDITVLPKKNI